MNNDIKLPTDYQNFIALSRYARWLEHESRRETCVIGIPSYACKALWEVEMIVKVRSLSEAFRMNFDDISVSLLHNYWCRE